MIRFNSSNPDAPAMNIRRAREADIYLKDYVNHIIKSTKDKDGFIVSLDKAYEIARNNLGYYCGYYDINTGKRVERLFKCKHPILGTVEERSKLTSQEIFEKGIEYTKSILRKI